VVAREHLLQTAYLDRYRSADDFDFGLRTVAIDIEFGTDGAGNVHDFGILFSNLSDSTLSITLQAITLSNGFELLTQPRVVGVDGKATELHATTTANSRGLDIGESSLFDDIFGDVAFATGLDVAHVRLSVPDDIGVLAVTHDPFFDSFFRLVPGHKTTTDVMISNLPVQTTTATGTRNWVALMNGGTSAQDVAIRGFTPGGTEYVLPTVTVPAGNRVDWSPDGQIFREDPTDTTGPPVPYMSFRLSSTGGLWYNLRRTRLEASLLYRWVQPSVLRDLRED
jgi:hypothetical protein